MKTKKSVQNVCKIRVIGTHKEEANFRCSLTAWSKSHKKAKSNEHMCYIKLYFYTKFLIYLCHTIYKMKYYLLSLAVDIFDSFETFKELYKQRLTQ